LDDFWKSMPNEVKVAREAIVKKFKECTLPQVLRARKNYMEHRKYEELGRSNPIVTEERPLPIEPKPDKDEAYWILVASFNVDLHIHVLLNMFLYRNLVHCQRHS